VRHGTEWKWRTLLTSLRLISVNILNKKKLLFLLLFIVVFYRPHTTEAYIATSTTPFYPVASTTPATYMYTMSASDFNARVSPLNTTNASLRAQAVIGKYPFVTGGYPLSSFSGWSNLLQNTPYNLNTFFGTTTSGYVWLNWDYDLAGTFNPPDGSLIYSEFYGDGAGNWRQVGSGTTTFSTFVTVSPEVGSTTAAEQPVTVGGMVYISNAEWQEKCNSSGLFYMNPDGTLERSCDLRMESNIANYDPIGSLTFTPNTVHTVVGSVATSTGYHTVTTQIPLLSNGFYSGMMQIWIGNVFWFSTTTRFVAGTSTLTQEQQDNFYDTGSPFTSATSTPLDSTNFLSFLNVPELLKTRVPYAYIYQFASALINAAGSSTIASTIPSSQFDITIGTGTYATTVPVVLFSTSTITHYINPTVMALFRGIMVAVTYLSFIFFVFHNARSKENI